MKLFILTFLLAAVVIVECKHTFTGTNVLRPRVYHHNVHYNAMMFRKRVENLYYVMPNIPSNYGRTIQGILVYDITNSDASAIVTMGGLGFNFVNIRMESGRGMDLHFEVFIYS